MIRTSLVLSAVFALALPAHAQVYKCVVGGRTIYSQTPCPANSQSTTIRRSGPTDPAPGAGKSGAPMTAAEQEQAFRKRQQEQQAAAKKQGEKAAESQQKQENCSNARSQLAQFEAGGRITRFDEKGERTYLGDDEIEQEKSRARALVDQWCR
jgi:uncharacterized protein DUF4124